VIFLRAIIESILGWLAGEARRGHRATTAHGSTDHAARVGGRISEYLRKRRMQQDSASGERKADSDSG